MGEDLARFRMLDCPSCRTSLFLQDDRMALAGDMGVMHDVPLLFALGDAVTIGKARYRPVGHARYSYGRGTWDEFWALVDTGDAAWLSVDEGDLVLQRPLGAEVPNLAQPPALGDQFTHRGQNFTVVEAEQATCAALRGNFPERLYPGERYRFVNATGPDGTLLSGEFGGGTAQWYLGTWVDPFAVKVARP